jgi:multidrug efflux pump subunit AcrB
MDGFTGSARTFFDGALALYAKGWMSCCGNRRITLVSFSSRSQRGRYLYVEVPKGFFPQQDTGSITGFTEAAQDVSFGEMTACSNRSPT